MKNLFTFLPWIGMIIFAGLFFCHKKEQPTFTLPAAKSDVTILERKVDAQGIEHATIKSDQNVIKKSDLKNENRPMNIIDSSAINLKIAATQIERVTRISSMTKDSLLKAKRVIDILTKRLAFAYSDKFVNLKYTPPVDTADLSDNGDFSFAYYADLDIVQYHKRKWLLGQKKSFIDISSKDKRTTINGVKQLTVEQESPDFGLRFQGSANFNPENGNLGFGPAVRLDLGRFSIQGNYLYYPKLATDKWRPGIIGNFDVIRF